MSEINTPYEDPSSRKLIAWLWKGYLHRHIWLIATALVLMSVEGGMLGVLSYLIKPMFDRVLVAQNGDAILWVAAAVFGVFSARAIASFVHRVIMSLVGQRVSAHIQSDMVRHILTLDGKFFQDHPPGTLIERTRGDSGAAANVWNTVLAAFGRDLVSLISLLVVAVVIDWRWTLIAVAGAPLLTVPITILQRVVRRTSRKARQASATVSTRLDEIFHGATTIKLASGYYHQGKLTPLVDESGWFDSKDLGQWDGEQVSIIGRADNQFISGGENIHCEEIERALNQLAEVKQAFVVPVEDGEFGFRPIAIVDCDELPTRDWFAEQLQKSLERFKFPIEYYQMPEQEQQGIKVSRSGLASWLFQHRKSK